MEVKDVELNEDDMNVLNDSAAEEGVGGSADA